MSKTIIIYASIHHKNTDYRFTFAKYSSVVAQLAYEDKIDDGYLSQSIYKE
ncbi:hypothetical protein [Treponema pedis]|uniref:hypothetical protein n=1 Tax=Treponema pedis TaxID=409322 RepID=UPI000411A722|nr:hypothetical protein [Treponema pedis]